MANEATIVPLQDIPAPAAEVGSARQTSACIVEVSSAKRKQLWKRHCDIAWGVFLYGLIGSIIDGGRVDAWSSTSTALALAAACRAVRSAC